jgi:hypothetical protein
VYTAALRVRLRRKPRARCTRVLCARRNNMPPRPASRGAAQQQQQSRASRAPLAPPRRPESLAVRLLLAREAFVTQLAHFLKWLAHAATASSAELKLAGERARGAARTASGPPGWDAAAVAAARHYERRRAVVTVLLAALVGIAARLFFGPLAEWSLRATLYTAFRFCTKPLDSLLDLLGLLPWILRPRAVAAWLFGTRRIGIPAADGGVIATLPATEGLVQRVAAALMALVPGVVYAGCRMLILAAGCLAYRYGWEVLQLHAPELAQVRDALRQRAKRWAATDKQMHSE